MRVFQICSSQFKEKYNLFYSVFIFFYILGWGNLSGSNVDKTIITFLCYQTILFNISFDILLKQFVLHCIFYRLSLSGWLVGTNKATCLGTVHHSIKWHVILNQSILESRYSVNFQTRRESVRCGDRKENCLL